MAIHLGKGEWMIVDSCVDRKTGNPVALDYLQTIGVDPQIAVKLVVITHWHNDHSRGISRILEVCSSSQFVLSNALRTQEFRTLLAASRFESENGIDELRKALDALKRMVGSGTPERKIFAIANRRLYQSPGVEIYSLSPSDRTITRAYLELGELLPKLGRRHRRIASHTANQTAVVLWLKFGDHLNVLLGSDLENSSDPSTGWAAILQSNQRPYGTASIFKVAHHGSANADEQAVWSTMMKPNVCAILTPFRSGDVLLPTIADRARLLGRTQQCYWTSAHNLPKPRLNPTVARVAGRMAKQLWRLNGPMGHVRARVKNGSGLPTVELFGRAEAMAVKISKRHKTI
jgi:beta-lactamase superfamily II metal-dependent hydrolase